MYSAQQDGARSQPDVVLDDDIAFGTERLLLDQVVGCCSVVMGEHSATGPHHDVGADTDMPDVGREFAVDADRGRGPHGDATPEPGLQNSMPIHIHAFSQRNLPASGRLVDPNMVCDDDAWRQFQIGVVDGCGRGDIARRVHGGQFLQVVGGGSIPARQQCQVGRESPEWRPTAKPQPKTSPRAGDVPPQPITHEVRMPVTPLSCQASRSLASRRAHRWMVDSSLINATFSHGRALQKIKTWADPVNSRLTN